MLRLFGPGRVDGLGNPRLPRLAYLAAAVIDLRPSAAIARSGLASLLWPDTPGPRASANLRQLLGLVRRWETIHDTKILEADKNTVSRGPSTTESDLQTFLSLGSITSSEDLQELGTLYAGDLLEDFSEMAGETQAWIGGQRNALRDHFVLVALEAARRVGGIVGDGVLRRLEQEAPFDDSVARARMIVAAQLSGASGACAVYQEFAARVETELGERPEPATQILLQELSGEVGHSPAVWAESVPTPISVSVGSVPKVLILPPTSEAGSSSRGTDMLGLSLIDEVTHTLSRARLFAVFAPHTARQLAVVPFPNGNPYGADYLVSTRLVPARGGREVLQVTLTHVGSHEVLLSDELDFAPGALSVDHYALASSLAAKLAGGIKRAEISSYRRSGSASAFVHYLLGTEYLGTFGLQRVRKARSHFQRALKLSPNFAPARAMLARSLCLEWLLLDRSDSELLATSLDLAKQALDEDPLDPIAHREVGHALIYLNQIDEAVLSFESGVNLGPHHADVLFHYADGLAHLGRIPEARKAMDRALDLNPLPPDFYLWVSATTDYFLGNYASASRTLDRLKEPEPAARVIALVEAMNGNMEKARKHRRIFMTNHPDFRLEDYLIPQKRKEDRDHYLAGMRKAGFN